MGDQFVPRKLFGVFAESPESENSIEKPEHVSIQDLPAEDSFVMRPYGVYLLVFDTKADIE